MASSDKRRRRWVRYWDKHSRTYDREIGFFDRVLFRDTRAWICDQARGEVLEVAIGTGLNLAHYPPEADVTGIDLSPQMLARAEVRAEELQRAVRLRTGDAEALDFQDASFDTVVCTFSLCAIPDHHRAVLEMVRVLRPGGQLLLADHVISTQPVVRTLQRLLELVSVPLGGEHYRRRPYELVRAAGLTVSRSDRFTAGLVERLVAVKP
ncbi:MAG: class I SAM-dependent methyltransferase [Actinomycetota bacterium]|nr:class I SAM-dependent methyltransferase [Actinomycetota bacterium]